MPRTCMFESCQKRAVGWWLPVIERTLMLDGKFMETTDEHGKVEWCAEHENALKVYTNPSKGNYYP